MRIMILAYPVVKPFAEAFEINGKTNSAGWIVGLHTLLLNLGNVVALVTPYKSNKKKIIYGNEYYYSFPWKYKDVIKENINNREYFEEILIDFKPDVVLAFGTEYTQTLSMLEAAEKQGIIKNTAIVMQGIISEISKAYCANVPDKIKFHRSLREYVNHMDIASQQKAFEKRGENEIKMIKKTRNVIGLSNWDKERIETINPEIAYYQCHNILRNEFFACNKWDVNKCSRHTILAVPSSFYPVKGIHFLIEGLYYVRMEYADVKLRITLDKPTVTNTFVQRAGSLSYETYIAELINRYELWDNIEFLGILNVQDLIEEYLKANVFVCSSSIENESQVTNEARIIGVPSVVSHVGATPERITQGEDGFSYQYDAPYMMARYIKDIFKDDKLACRISKSSVERLTEILRKETLEKKWTQILSVLSNPK